MLRREAMLRHASVNHYIRKIDLGMISAEDFKMIECGTANVIVKKSYDGDIQKWTDIVNAMGEANPKVFEFLIKNESDFIKDLKNTL